MELWQALVCLIILFLVARYFRRWSEMSEYDKAMSDARIYGSGYLRIGPDGKHKRVAIEDIYMEVSSMGSRQ